VDLVDGRRDGRGTQSTTEMLPSPEKGAKVLHIASTVQPRTAGLHLADALVCNHVRLLSVLQQTVMVDTMKLSD